MTELNQQKGMPEVEKQEENKLEDKLIKFMLFLAIVLFVYSSIPDNLMGGISVGLMEFRNDYIYITVPASLILVCIVALGFERGRKKLTKKKLTMLSNAEKKVLARYVAENTTALELKETEKGVAGLMQYQVIRKQFITHRKISFNNNYVIKPWVLEYLNKHPEIIEIEKQKKVKI